MATLETKEFLHFANYKSFQKAKEIDGIKQRDMETLSGTEDPAMDHPGTLGSSSAEMSVVVYPEPEKSVEIGAGRETLAIKTENENRDETKESTGSQT